MPPVPGTRLGPYEVIGPIGAGGMGEVYRARDTRLGRDVALKVLQADLAADPKFRERFEREARSVSALNHPNICTLYDVGHEAGIDFLVMELLDGETLAARLTRGPLPLPDVLTLGIQVAAALAAAHRQDIVHRDLKPGNVMLTKAGAKLLDFGLAKSTPSAGTAEATTMTGRLTGQGTILGTFQYMAPEQIEGHEADARSDLFAFGAVLFEMVTGRTAFAGRTDAALMGAILRDDPPPVSHVQPLTPPALERLIGACLAKDPDERIQTAHDVGLQLKWIQAGGSAAGVPGSVVARRRPGERVLGIALAAVTILWLVTLVPAVSFFRSVPIDEPPMRFIVPMPGTPVQFSRPVPSPDGRWLTVVAEVGEPAHTRLWIRPIGSQEFRQLPGTEDAVSSSWSPDSRQIAFVADGKLKVVDIAGGRPLTLTDAPQFTGATWSREHVIVFASGGTLYRIPAEGGTATELARPDATQGHRAYRFPSFLPDGQHLLCLAVGDPSTVSVLSVEGGPVTPLFRADSRAQYAPPGFILYHQDGSLLARPFDAGGLRMAGEPVQIGDDVASGPNGSAAFHASEDGRLLVLRGASAPPLAELVWRDRSGRALRPAGEPATYSQVRLSPDDRFLVTSRWDRQAGKYNLWTVDLNTDIASQLVAEDRGVDDPVWAGDSRSVAFESVVNGRRDFFSRAIGGASTAPLFESPDTPKWLDDWSRDGRYIIFHTNAPGRLFAVPMSGDRTPIMLADFRANVDQVHVSPDGKWVAYCTDDSGSWEVWVASFPALAARQQVSVQGGGQPLWSGNSRELFYLTPDGDVMSAAVSVTSSGALRAAVPVNLFRSPIPTFRANIDQYAVTGDGQRFLFIEPRPNESTVPSPITVIVNWPALIRR